MSHHPIIATPAGTATPDRTVGELVAERPGRSRVFQARGIDFCCQGGRTVREACEKKGIELETVLRELEEECKSGAKLQFNPAELSPQELVDYIVETHHAFLRRELPRLQAMAARVAHVHGGHTPSLIQVHHVFEGLLQELTSHMIKEEQVLFPSVAAMSRGETASMTLEGPIACMVHEHEEAGNALARLNELTSGYTPPVDACNTYRALFAGLADLEEDLHRHIHLENSVLFPAAERMQNAA